MQFLFVFIEGEGNISDLSLLDLSPTLIRDAKPGLASNTFGTTLQFRFAQNDT